MWNLPPIYICIGVCIAIKTGIQVTYTQKLGGLSASYPYMLCTRSRQISDFMYQYARHLCWIDRVVHLSLVSICFLYALVFPYIFLYKLTVSNGLSLATLNSKEFTQWSGSFKQGGPSAFGIYMPVYALVFSYIFPISWLFRMGSHWWHWTVKRLLSALAVLNRGEGGEGQIYPPRGKSENLSSFQVLLLYILISWPFQMGSHWWHWTVKRSLSALAVLNRGEKGEGHIYPPGVNLKIWAHFKFCSCFTEHIEQWRDHSVLWQFQMGGGRGGSDLPPGVNLKIWAHFKFCSCFTELFHFYK